MVVVLLVVLLVVVLVVAVAKKGEGIHCMGTADQVNYMERNFEPKFDERVLKEVFPRAKQDIAILSNLKLTESVVCILEFPLAD